MPSKRRASGGTGIRHQVGLSRKEQGGSESPFDYVPARPNLREDVRGELEDLFVAAGAGRSPSRADVERVRLSPDLPAAAQKRLRAEMLDRAIDIAAEFQGGSQGPARYASQVAMQEFAEHLDPVPPGTGDLDGLSPRELAARVPRSGIRL